ncbi:MAG: sugar phosphorylase [Desulfobacterales bacterium]|jgi:sucrose phosphorylase
MQTILQRIYGKQKAAVAASRIAAVLDVFSPQQAAAQAGPLTEADAILVTYGDTLTREGERPLCTLHRFATQHFKGVFSGIHILPFFPYSSDDGFSVTDFLTVRSDLGSWKDVRAIGADFKLMIDLVANHVSAESRWFQNYLAGEKGFEHLAIEVDPAADLSGVTRPRSLPLLTEFDMHSGRRVHLWTTFSADQIDLNYESLDVLENMLRALLFYVSQGARIIRLDAVAYLWKQIGTPCIHLPQAHDLVRLFRRILDLIAPGVVLITETNVPHEENIRYFGDGYDEAQLVYNFTLPPLLLYSLVKGKARELSEWARTLATPSADTAFFNFTASHDGIGVRPLEGILTATDISWLADIVWQNGGNVSMRGNPDGSQSPYELNITYVDALRNPDQPDDPLLVPRFLASQAVALVLPGVPAVYIHSILASRNWTEGVRQTGRARTINRAKLITDALDTQLADPQGFRARIFFPYLDLVRLRTRQPAFHPAAGAQVLHLDDRVFVVKRFCREQTLIAVTNLSADTLTVTLPEAKGNGVVTDLISRRRFPAAAVPISPYGIRWLDL